MLFPAAEEKPTQAAAIDVPTSYIARLVARSTNAPSTVARRANRPATPTPCAPVLRTQHHTVPPRRKAGDSANACIGALGTNDIVAVVGVENGNELHVIALNDLHGTAAHLAQAGPAGGRPFAGTSSPSTTRRRNAPTGTPDYSDTVRIRQANSAES